MPQSCSVLGCKSVLRKNSGISFHCFPKQEKMRQRWLRALSYGVLEWNRRPRVCSKHFKKEDFVLGGNIVKLNKFAIPNMGLVDNILPSSSELEDIPTTYSSTMTNAPIVAEIGPANCMSPPSPSNNVIATTSGISPYSMEAVINTKHQAKDCTLKVTTTKRTLKLVSEPTRNFMESPWSSEEPDQAEVGLNMLITSTPQIEKDSTDIRSCKENCPNLKTVIILENEVAYLKQENKRLQLLSMPKPLFCLQQFSANNKKILYYTGFQTYQILSLVFKWVLPTGNVKDLIHDTEKKNYDRLSKLSAEDQFFLTLIRLRRGMPIETISDLFAISRASADSIFLCWINLLYLRLGSLNIWPNRNELIKRASDSMRQNYPNVIGSIDCTEFYIQRPSSLVKQSQCYSNYKGTTTLKSLIMTDPGGAIIYTSPLFTGSISDKAIIEDSGFIDILKEKVDEGNIFPGDSILADKGFNIRDLLEAIHLEINIPVFRVGGTQFTTEEVSTIRKVAHERIHVERAIGRLKNYQILSSKIPISSLGSIQQIYTVCVLLSNFRHGLIAMNT